MKKRSIVNMMKKHIILLILLISCSQIKKSKPKVTFDHDVELSINGTKTKLEKGKSLELKTDDLIQFSAPGKVPLMLYPKNKQSNAKISLPSISKEAFSQALEQEVNKKIDDIFPQIHQVQQLILKENYSDAISKIRNLKSKYPNIAYISFIEGAAYSVLKRYTEAKRALNEGLEIFPESVDGKELYRQISGGTNQ